MISHQPYVGRAEILAALDLVRAVMPATPCMSWPLLNIETGCQLWVKHENHTPIGSFKIRGGLVYMQQLIPIASSIEGVITGTRGNHGQSVAMAASRAGFDATIVVPRANSRSKNMAMRALGAEVIEHGDDFQDALNHAHALAGERNLHFVPAFERRLVVGVATCAWELFHQQPAIDWLYVPIGLGSGICGAVAARDALGLSTKIVGVVADNAPAYALSIEAGSRQVVPVRPTIADGVACREPHPDALAIVSSRVERIVRVSEQDIRAAMRWYYRCTHNIAEGAGALTLAAVLQERPSPQMRVGLILSGANVDWDVYRDAIDSASDPDELDQRIR